ncbi:1,4-dihydroxy-2-naphthoate polyprenyltransferase [Lacticaseibacillus nasuensis]|uniref:1,4-dihydroxy-2-naphthoate polyprenyltransferase n=1 Tax=Lacticaseibacillus nasuensis TaxID=944671 RepID=UPI0007049CB2|nr:1,4-dihydroxy-2-naphthoate polyprenyltransferase [Lacticaseibacillus nasuensis]MCX2454925.1 1,4-dihydroxy-2-naphthoate polyprenyltransferase [Lacticaseibacillus nasuensis]
MKPSVFFELVEIKAKTASVFPFLMGTLYAWYHWHQLHWLELVVFFVAMLLFNMAVDANDNYQDYRRATRTTALQFREQTNIIGREHLNPSLIGWLIVGMMTVSGALGLWMVSRTGWPLLVMGLFSFAVGYCYAGGPRPISTTPVGEFFSGFTMGFVIWLIAVYVNVFDVAAFDWALVGRVFVASGLAQGAIAALLLANNIADEAEDKQLKRRTIVYYLGRQRSLRFFAALYTVGFLALIVAAVVGWLPRLSLLTLVTVPLVWRNVRGFAAKPVKRLTFKLAIQNLFVTTLAQVVFMALGVALHV